MALEDLFYIKTRKIKLRHSKSNASGKPGLLYWIQMIAALLMLGKPTCLRHITLPDCKHATHASHVWLQLLSLCIPRVDVTIISRCPASSSELWFHLDHHMPGNPVEMHHTSNISPSFFFFQVGTDNMTRETQMYMGCRDWGLGFIKGLICAKSSCPDLKAVNTWHLIGTELSPKGKFTLG